MSRKKEGLDQQLAFLLRLKHGRTQAGVVTAVLKPINILNFSFSYCFSFSFSHFIVSVARFEPEILGLRVVNPGHSSFSCRFKFEVRAVIS
jgi:hypothetical protein